eukprot:TRINITY_DN36170_c0_g1_i1.p1 TRINITY_DN36170_c0_g1~~TRINITY_DN36170_c0_g1_i1.p1  ORF type:complete len:1074 (-),score=212.77 TRINITY_DN36170_c0_g1_i1:53-3274(-)
MVSEEWTPRFWDVCLGAEGTKVCCLNSGNEAESVSINPSDVQLDEGAQKAQFNVRSGLGQPALEVMQQRPPPRSTGASEEVLIGDRLNDFVFADEEGSNQSRPSEPKVEEAETATPRGVTIKAEGSGCAESDGTNGSQVSETSFEFKDELQEFQDLPKAGGRKTTVGGKPKGFAQARMEQRAALKVELEAMPATTRKSMWVVMDKEVRDSKARRPSVKSNVSSQNSFDSPKSTHLGEPIPMDEYPDDEVEVDERREMCKTAIAATLVALLFLALLLSLRLLGAAHGEADCSGVEARRSCEVCGTGTSWIPIGGDWEKTWPAPLRSVLYFFGLIWCFLGVGIICDEFTEAIETITMQEHAVWKSTPSGARIKRNEPVWNTTLANLSLMALGSSAPEILLSSIELVSNDFKAGSLGPQTVVGSAAFNLLCITAVCISAIPVGETRRIEKFQVYIFTASASVFAYLWVMIMIVVITPDKVDIAEGVATLLMMFVFLAIAFGVDKMTSKDGGLSSKEEEKAEAMRRALQEESGTEVSLGGIRSMLMQQKELQEMNKMLKSEMRREFVNRFVGGKRGFRSSMYAFPEPNHCVLECAGYVYIPVVAKNPPNSAVFIEFSTRDGEAKAGQRYESVSGQLRFSPGEEKKTIEIKILDNDSWDPAEEFYVDLLSIEAPGLDPAKAPLLGPKSCAIWVINDDEPGTLDFESNEVMVDAGTTELQVTVVRSNGDSGEITCDWELWAVTCVVGVDIADVGGTLRFEDHQETATIVVPVLRVPEVSVKFRIKLSNASEGVLFDAMTDGGMEAAVCNVILSGSTSSRVQNCAEHLRIDCGELMLALRSWQDKLGQAFYCGGSLEDQAEASVMEWIMHGVSLVWKVLFLAVPPSSLLGGWPAFLGALVMIGFVTVIIKDMASMLGCSIGMEDDVTALTLVALGTSLPDTMASRTAAKQDDCADNSVGNVTGSNAVNVFLGLGISWTIGALYWASVGPNDDWRSHYEELYMGVYPEGGFIVPAGRLAFSVAFFSGTALVCVSLLYFRRRFYGGELGGPRIAQMRDSILLVLLWVVFIAANVVYSQMEGG